MATERTLSIIKPDATRRNLTGKINACSRMPACASSPSAASSSARPRPSSSTASHKERPFFGGLVEFMTSGPVVVQVLEGENAVARNREVMGATDPAKAEPRARSASSLPRTSRPTRCTAPTAPRMRRQEIAFFFKEDEIVG